LEIGFSLGKMAHFPKNTLFPRGLVAPPGEMAIFLNEWYYFPRIFIFFKKQQLPWANGPFPQELAVSLKILKKENKK
jgi:hypothetical protein